jgi:hypothetical protein
MNFNLLNVINSLNPRAHEIDTEALAANIRASIPEPGERVLLRRELDAIEDKLAVKPKYNEQKRKLDLVWKPRVAELEKLLVPQQEKLASLMKSAHLHPPQATVGKIGLCTWCSNKAILEDNIAAIEDPLKNAKHWVDALTRECRKLKETFESVTRAELKRRDELKEKLEASEQKRVLEQRVKIPPMTPINTGEPKGNGILEALIK